MSTISFVHHLVKSTADLICGYFEDEPDREVQLLGIDVRQICKPDRLSIQLHIVYERYPSNEYEAYRKAVATAAIALS